MVRDYEGKLLLATSFPLLDVSVPLAEMIAAWNVIKLAVYRVGATKRWIEGDALGTVLAVKKGSGAEG